MNNDLILDNNNNNKKCTLHRNKILELLCLDLFFQDGQHHGHKTNCMDSKATSDILKMVNLFKNDIIPKLKEIVENNKQIINESDNIYNEIKQQYEINKNLVIDEFNKFHKILQIIQLDILKQLETTFDENTLVNTIINSSIKNNDSYGITMESMSNEIDNLKHTHLQYCDENQIYNWLENEEIYQLIKKYQQSSLIVNNKNYIGSLNILKEYNNQSILFNN
ncbi:hypothetical protein DDB_G0290609 [Dictyostelium discoideum AX4]|uniref:Uncharacterized protein n=1 Tax=Dictyostelium discoideum TaxID=44689 RepID=Q54FS8_DICDI|nr:hypothetical protein DDB_G0290609 [Dictyostelium discoideum AX4]EAL62165.1 hypothetical protein DDB_G0290609 [Dictyostelium discoideum AX4]|eukprot:XP_635689.1 hypothetical protein DDB_G0290609 [Dictyostelium discoideum AX4]